MIGEICKYLNNYFVHDDKDVLFGTFVVSNGVLDVYANNEALSDVLNDGQYIRIVGSVFNDGVYQYPTANLTDEVFDGAVWAMSVPHDFLALANDIRAWCEDEAVQKALQGPYSSESFGGYSYSKETGSDGGLSWKDHFSGRLNMWRKAATYR